jgi:tetratricopeptide (TPR) repeat protein
MFNSDMMITINELIEENDLEKALEIIENLTNGQENDLFQKNKLLLLKAKIYNKSAKYNMAKQLAEKIISSSNDQNLFLIKIEAIISLVQSLCCLGDGENALKYTNLALESLKECKNQSLEDEELKKADLYYWQGIGNDILGNFDDAISSCQHSKDISEKIGDFKGISNVYNILGSIYLSKGDFSKAISNLDNSLRICENSGHFKGIRTIYNNKGNAYWLNGDLLSALEHYEKALELSKLEKDSRLEGIAISNIANIYVEQGKLLEALDYLDKALKLEKTIGNKGSIATSLLMMSNVYRQTGELEKAFELLKESFALRKAVKNPFNISESLTRLISLSIDMNNVTLADELLQELNSIQLKENNKIITLRYQFSYAFVLKEKNLISDELNFKLLHQILSNILISEKIFNDIIIDAVLDPEISIEAIFNLCDLIILELNILGQSSKFAKLEELTNTLLVIAEKQKSYSLLSKSYLLKAKLAFINLDFVKSNSLLNNSLLLSQKYGLSALEKVIQNEKMLMEGEKINFNNTFSLTDRMRRVNLNGFMGALRQNRLESFISNTNANNQPNFNDLKRFADQLKNRNTEW